MSTELTIAMWIGTLLAVAMLIWGVLVLMRYQNMRMTSGKVCCTIITRTGRKISEFVPYDGNVVWIKLENDRIIGVDPPTKFVPRRATKQSRQLIAAGMYFFNEDCLVRSVWPYRTGWARSILSVEIRECIWMEGQPEPISNPRLREAIEEAQSIAFAHQSREIGHMVVTPKIVNAYCDQTTMIVASAMEEQVRELQQALVDVSKKFVHPILVYLAIAIGVAGLAAMSVILYSSLSKLNDIKDALGV